MLNFGEHVGSTKEKLQKHKTYWKRLLVAVGAEQETLSDLQSYRSELPELRWSYLDFHNQRYKLEPPANTTKHCSSDNYLLCKNMSDTNDLHNEDEILPV